MITGLSYPTTARTVATLITTISLVLTACGGSPSEQPSTAGPSGPAPTEGPAASEASTPSPSGAASDPGPGEAAITSPPVEFTACIPRNAGYRTGTDEQIALPSPDGDVTVDVSRGHTWRGTITATDDRLSGTHFYSFNHDTYTLPGGSTQSSWAEDHRIENDEGAWHGSSVGFTDADGVSLGGGAVLTGEGSYEGLTAIIATSIEGDCFINVRGFVTSVPATPAPVIEE